MIVHEYYHFFLSSRVLFIVLGCSYDCIYGCVVVPVAIFTILKDTIPVLHLVFRNCFRDTGTSVVFTRQCICCRMKGWGQSNETIYTVYKKVSQPCTTDLHGTKANCNKNAPFLLLSSSTVGSNLFSPGPLVPHLPCCHSWALQYQTFPNKNIYRPCKDILLDLIRNDMLCIHPDNYDVYVN